MRLADKARALGHARAWLDDEPRPLALAGRCAWPRPAALGRGPPHLTGLL
ncbi:MAG: hypothetical protein R2939_14090 [Kofleriaceae bacterium]